MREAITLVALVVLAGCINPTGGPELDAAANETRASVEAKPAPVANETPVTVATNATVLVTNATSFIWRSNATYGDIALSMRIVALEETNCDVRAAMARDGGGPGYDFVRAIVRNGALGGISGGGGGGFASVHVQDVSSEDVLDGDGNGAVSTGSSTEVGPEGIELVLAGRDAAAWETDITENGSVLVNVTCDAAIVVSDFAYSHEVALYSVGGGTTGVGVSGFLVGVGLQELVSLDATSPRVLAALWSSGPAQVRVSSPDGQTTALTHPLEPARILVEGGSGAWSMGVDAALGASAVLGVIVGLQPIDSWDAIPPRAA